MEFLEQHGIISKEFKIPHVGSSDIWNDYASYGLFVCDYKVYMKPYLKMADPSKPMESGLRARILQIKEFTRYSEVFSIG